jgi:hypothetical protein
MSRSVVTEADELEESARHCDSQADEQDRMAEWERKVFPPNHSVEVYHNKAALFRNTAKSLRLQAKTGVEHCACHLTTMEACRERARGRR